VALIQHLPFHGTLDRMCDEFGGSVIYRGRLDG
jgi:hypothetical protein